MEKTSEIVNLKKITDTSSPTFEQNKEQSWNEMKNGQMKDEKLQM